MENIFTAAYPFLVYAKLLGVFPIDFDGLSRGELKVRCRDLGFSVVLFSVLLFLVCGSVFNLTVSSNCESSAIAWKIIVLLNVISVSLAFVYQMFHLRSVVEFINQLHEIDNEVRRN
jgi:hypothetical protein